MICRATNECCENVPSQLGSAASTCAPGAINQWSFSVPDDALQNRNSSIRILDSSNDAVNTSTTSFHILGLMELSLPRYP